MLFMNDPTLILKLLGDIVERTVSFWGRVLTKRVSLHGIVGEETYCQIVPG